MPKARELTEVEKFYIENNPQQSDEEIASQIKGVGAKTVEKFRASITPAQDDKRDSITETREERIDRLKAEYESKNKDKIHKPQN